MMILKNCTITDPDELIGPLEGAVISVSGESPNATVRISARDVEHRKYRHVDRVLGASIRGSERNWSIEGHSEQLATLVGTSDDSVSLKIEVKGGCEGCR